MRFVRYLLANTRFKIKVNYIVSLEFKTFNGSFQGDAASGAFSTLYFDGALYHLRAVTTSIWLNPPLIQPPTEWEHADDGNFVDEAEDEGTLKQTLPICKKIMAQWELLVD